MTGASVSLVYNNGDACPTSRSTNQSTVIVFVCDDSATDSSTPPTLISSAASCALVFEVRTALVCPKNRVECIVTDDTNHATYDLSALSRASSQWTVLGNGYEFLLGVCTPLGSAPPCDTGAAACQLKSSE